VGLPEDLSQAAETSYKSGSLDPVPDPFLFAE